MADIKSNTGKGGGAVLAGGAAAALGILLGLAQKKEAAGGDDTALLDLLAQIRDAILAEQNEPPSGDIITVNALTPQYRTVKPIRVVIAVANIPQQLPSYTVPPGTKLKVKAGFSNLGVIYVGGSMAEAGSINQSEPLTANEFTLYQIADAENIYISGTQANDFVTLIAEVE